MSLYERLYDESEKTQVRFVGFLADRGRYDFAIVYTQLFFGKPLVVCMQTGRSALLSLEDVEHLDYLQRLFNLKTEKEAEEIAIFFQHHLPAIWIHAESE